jgi:NitT/TauT family transport system substrate-binding protein
LQHIAENNGLAQLADSVDFIPWRDPDELRLLAIEGRADVLGAPVNVAANLYNRGVPLRLVNVSAWGMLWLVSRRPGPKTLADFRGEEIAMPFRGDMPDIVFGLVARALDLDPRRDFRLRYVASPLDAMQLLVSGRIEHALLAEPAVSMALRKTRSFPMSAIAPELHRSVDMQQEWGRVLRRPPRIAQAGIAVLGPLREDAAAVAAIARAYAAALAQCKAQALSCGEMVARRNERLSAEAVADSLAASPMEAVGARRARGDIELLLRELLAANPALVGGRLPDDGFYGDT